MHFLVSGAESLAGTVRLWRRNLAKRLECVQLAAAFGCQHISKRQQAARTLNAGARFGDRMLVGCQRHQVDTFDRHCRRFAVPLLPGPHPVTRWLAAQHLRSLDLPITVAPAPLDVRDSATPLLSQSPPRLNSSTLPFTATIVFPQRRTMAVERSSSTIAPIILVIGLRSPRPRHQHWQRLISRWVRPGDDTPACVHKAQGVALPLRDSLLSNPASPVLASDTSQPPRNPQPPREPPPACR